MEVRTPFPHIGADGKFYYTTFQGQIMRIDPDTMKKEELGRFDPFALAGYKGLPGDRLRSAGLVNFAPECCGRKEAIGLIEWAGACVKLDTETGKITKLGQAVPRDALTWLDTISAFALGNGSSAGAGKLYTMLLHQPRGATRMTELYELDLATGRTRNLGTMHDERGRLVETVNSMSVGGDGKLYFQATVYCLPGDRLYSYRIEPEIHGVIDTCFMQVDPAPAGKPTVEPARGRTVDKPAAE